MRRWPRAAILAALLGPLLSRAFAHPDVPAADAVPDAAPIAEAAPAETAEASGSAAPAASPTPAPARASMEVGDASVTVEAQPALARVGDLVAWEVTVDAPETTAVAEPVLTGEPGTFELREPFRLLREDARAGRTRRVFRAALAAFDVGPQTFPAAELELRAAEGAVRVALPAVGVAVESVLPPAPAPSPELRAAKGVLRLPSWSPWALAAAAAAVLGVMLYLYFRSRRPVVLAAQPRVPELPFDQRALAELKKLQESGLLGEGRTKEFHVRLSEILRAYLGSRYGFDALEMTSDELHRSLRELRAEPAARDLVRSLGDLADLVKFARHEPAAFENERALSDAFRLVETTRPLPSRVEPALRAQREGAG